MAKRRKIPADVEARVLLKCARRCCLCFALDGDFREKEGQIAHLDHNRANNAESNLAFLCLKHHSLYDSTTSQHKNYTTEEVKQARAKLHAEVEKAKPLEWSIVLDAKIKDFNLQRVEAITEHLRTVLEDPYISITRVKRGSVRLDVSSAEATYTRMLAKFERREITSVLGQPIQRLATARELDDEKLLAAKAAARVQESLDRDGGWSLWDRDAATWVVFDRLASRPMLHDHRGEAEARKAGVKLLRAISELGVHERGIIILSLLGWSEVDMALLLDVNEDLIRAQRDLAVKQLNAKLSGDE
jgi:hypothetical protein